MSFLSTLSLRRATRRASRQHPAGEFLSTLSLRRATIRRAVLSYYQEFLSTLSLRRATICRHEMLRKMRVSIHALLAESDRFCPTCQWRRSVFLSTLSLRRATPHEKLVKTDTGVSIHALLAESDLVGMGGMNNHIVSIHALLAESDHITTTIICIVSKFLSTLSLRRATRNKF